MDHTGYLLRAGRINLNQACGRQQRFTTVQAPVNALMKQVLAARALHWAAAQQVVDIARGQVVIPVAVFYFADHHVRRETAAQLSQNCHVELLFWAGWAVIKRFGRICVFTHLALDVFTHFTYLEKRYPVEGEIFIHLEALVISRLIACRAKKSPS